MMLLLLEVLHAETSSHVLWDMWLPIDPIMLKIKYSKYLQDKEDKKDTKVSLGSYKYY